MNNSDLESKIRNLEARLKAENEASQRESLVTDLPIFCSPMRVGSGRRPKPCKYLILSAWNSP